MVTETSGVYSNVFKAVCDKCANHVVSRVDEGVDAATDLVGQGGVSTNHVG